jgi:hypothetical protein
VCAKVGENRSDFKKSRKALLDKTLNAVEGHTRKKVLQIDVEHEWCKQLTPLLSRQ